LKRVDFLTAPNQPYRLVALEQIQASSRCLSARARKPTVAIEKQECVALRDRCKRLYVIWSGYAESFLT
jgi:hypothetical protein